MAVRYRAELDSYSGQQWKIDIYDSTYSGAMGTFQTDQPQIIYKGLTERNDPILASTLTVPFHVANATDEAFIDTVMTSQEERFTVIVYKNTFLHWCGVLLADEVTKEDRYYPYTVGLTFTDGLARLKDLPYNNSGTAYTGRVTLLAHVLNCILRAGINDLYGTNDIFLTTAVNWYDIRHQYATARCTLAYTDLDHSIFYKTDSDGNTEYKTCYEVLEMILSTFNARIMMDSGKFRIIQQQDYARTSTLTRQFNKAGTLKASGPVSYRVSQPAATRKAGAVYKFMKPLKEVTKVYKPAISSNESGSILPVQQGWTPEVALMNILPEQTVKINGQIRERFALEDNSGATVSLYSKWRLDFILTTTGAGTKYYLTNKNGPYQWSTTSTDYVTIQGPIFSGWDWDATWELAIGTPQVPAESTGTFQLRFTNHYTTNGVIWPIADNFYYAEYIDWGVFPDISADEGNTDPLEFKAINTLTGGGTVASTSILELKETLIGDGPTAVHIGKLMSNNGSAYDESTLWGVHNSTTRVNINQLAVNQVLSGQRVPVEVIQAAFINTSISAVLALVEGAKIYAPLSVTISMLTDEASGEWFNCAIPA